MGTNSLQKKKYSVKLLFVCAKNEIEIIKSRRNFSQFTLIKCMQCSRIQFMPTPDQKSGFHAMPLISEQHFWIDKWLHFPIFRCIIYSLNKCQNCNFHNAYSNFHSWKSLHVFSCFFVLKFNELWVSFFLANSQSVIVIYDLSTLLCLNNCKSHKIKWQLGQYLNMVSNFTNVK